MIVLPAGPFKTVVADPPWPYSDRLGPDGAEAHYRVMTLRDIAHLPVEASCETPAHLYLWTTNSFMREAHEIALCWGFTPKTILTWVKPRMGMGHYFRNDTEHVVFAVKGKMNLMRRDLRTAFTAPYLRHSEKPDRFFEIVEAASPGPRLELFARRQRAGWTCWGDEIEAAEPRVVAPV